MGQLKQPSITTDAYHIGRNLQISSNLLRVNSQFRQQQRGGFS